MGVHSLLNKAPDLLLSLLLSVSTTTLHRIIAEHLADHSTRSPATSSSPRDSPAPALRKLTDLHQRVNTVSEAWCKTEKALSALQVFQRSSDAGSEGTGSTPHSQQQLVQAAALQVGVAWHLSALCILQLEQTLLYSEHFLSRMDLSKDIDRQVSPF